MFSVIKNNPVSVMLAVLLHILIVAFLVFGFDWSKVRKPATSNANVVQAHTVDAKQLDQSKEKEKAAQRETLRKEALKRKQAEEKKRQQQLEQKRIAKEKAERQKQEAERKRQAKLKKEREAKEAKRKAEEKRLAALEAKRKAEAKHKAEEEARRKAELERKRKAELEAKRRAEAKRKAEAAAQAERERALQDQLAAEQNSREIDRYVAVIKQQIERNWLKPGQAAKGLACIVQVRLIPGGDVIPGGVSIVSSSGNAAFDRSVETAVYKAAPLQVPSGPLFESFRTLRLKFKPSS